MDEEALKLAIFNAFRLTFPTTPIILADQNEIRPPLPYLTYKLMTGPTRAAEDWEHSTDADAFATTGPRDISVSVNYYGRGALSALTRLQTRLQYPSLRAILSQVGAVFVSDSGVRDVSMLLETQTEARAQMDVNLRLTVSDSDPTVSEIDTAEIDGASVFGTITVTKPDGGN